MAAAPAGTNGGLVGMVRGADAFGAGTVVAGAVIAAAGAVIVAAGAVIVAAGTGWVLITGIRAIMRSSSGGGLGAGAETTGSSKRIKLASVGARAGAGGGGGGGCVGALPMNSAIATRGGSVAGASSSALVAPWKHGGHTQAVGLGMARVRGLRWERKRYRRGTHTHAYRPHL